MYLYINVFCVADNTTQWTASFGGKGRSKQSVRQAVAGFPAKTSTDFGQTSLTDIALLDLL